MSATTPPARPDADSANSLSAEFWAGDLDLRPIALFRVCFGLFILYDLCDLFPHLVEWFSDAGVMPRNFLLQEMIRPNRIALSDAFGAPAAMFLYWALAFAAVLCMTVGWHTRIAQFVAYVFIAGFNERLPPLFDGSDSVIRLTLFWLCFCPSGNRYSVDALSAAADGRPLPQKGLALPMRLVQGQIAWVYLCTFLHKTGGNTWHLLDQAGQHLDFNNAALHYVLHLNHVFARPWTSIVADYPLPMAFGTAFTMVMESTFLFLVFSPIARRYTKALALLAGVALHGGIACTVNVGLFSYLMPICYLSFLEPDWVEKGLNLLGRLCAAGPVVVLYDGACAVCRRRKVQLEAMDRFGRLQLVDFRAGELPAKARELKPKVLEKGLHAITPDGQVHAGWAALAAIYRRLPATFAVGPLMFVPGVYHLGAAIHGRLTEWRHEVGPVEVRERPPLLPAAWRAGLRTLGYPALAALFLCTAWYAAPRDIAKNQPRVTEMAVQWLSLWNVWDMFSPEPLRTDYHLRAVAEFSDGSKEDLFGGPADGPGEVRGFWFSRWWKYLENVTGGGETMPREWGRWHCRNRNWNAPPGSRLLYTFTLQKENQVIPPIGQPWPPVQVVNTWIHRCYDKPGDKK